MQNVKHKASPTERSMRITFDYGDDNVITFKDVIIPDCKTIEEVRRWLNESGKFISIKETLLNLSTLHAISIYFDEEVANGSN